MKIAIVGAGFAPEEADRLRRAMATFKRNGDIHLFRDKFVAGMVANGYERDFAVRCFSQIEGFGTYGFPESHAASFALLVYVSAWIKCFYPEVFACALLNSQPMGFYAPAQIVRDAREHGVEVRAVDVNHSEWDCTLEPQIVDLPSTRGARSRCLVMDAGLARRIARISCGPSKPVDRPRSPPGRSENEVPAAGRCGSAFARSRDWPRPMPSGSSRRAGRRDIPIRRRCGERSGLGRAALERLAEADAFRSVGLDRRRALWALKALGEPPLPLFAATRRPLATSRTLAPPSRGEGRVRGARRGERMESRAPPTSPPPGAEKRELAPPRCCREMPLGEHVVEDYRSLGLSLKRHPLAFLRAELAREGLVAAADLAHLPVERRLAIAGIVLIRQRPGSANGVVFITIEDETGVANLIVWPPILERFRRAALGATLLRCTGRLQREESVIHIVADHLRGPDPAAQHLARAQWRRRAAGKAADATLLAATRATSSCAAAISASGRALGPAPLPRIAAMAARASASARSFSGWPAWPRTHSQATSCGAAAASSRCHRSIFLTGFLSAVRQPRAFQAWIHRVMPSRRYWLSL